MLEKNKKGCPKLILEMYYRLMPHHQKFPPLKHPYHYLPIALPFTSNNRMERSNIDNKNKLVSIVMW
jgi:hypothetical protein